MEGKELITELAHRMGWTQGDTSKMFVTLGEVVSSRMVDGDVVAFQGLGQFETRKLTERLAVDEDKEKHYLLPPELIPVFKADDTLVNLIISQTNDNDDQKL